ncbi:MAG: TlpA disulfide reductase family protein [Pyrinomonadaceae bacterium]
MRFFAFLLLPFAFCLTACKPAAAPVSVSDKPVSINNIPNTNLPMPPSKPLGEMSWTGFDGKEQKLKDLRGKVVVLDFWATYCPPCLEEIPHLNQLQTKYGAENLQVVGLHVGDEEDRLRVPDFIKKLNVKYPIAAPEDALTSFIFAAQNDIPQTAVFDRSGNLVQKFIGFDLTVKNRLDKAVMQAVNTQ